jgi:IS5 family transposase
MGNIFVEKIFFKHNFLCILTSIGKWRFRVGSDKLKSLIEETIRIAKSQNFTTNKDLSRVIVNTTVQEKNITRPTNTKLLSRTIIKLGILALRYNIKLRQSYSRKAKQKVRQASGYAASHQYNRLNRCVKDLKNWLGRLLRDIERKLGDKSISPHFEALLNISKKLLEQEKNTKKKIYSLHEPEVQCISNGKKI